MNRLEKRGKVTIVDEQYVWKEENDFHELENYLQSRDFPYFLPVVKRENKRNTYNYMPDYSVNYEQKIEDIIKTVALLHNKTSFNKEVSSDKYHSIYDNLLGYINYVDDYYQKLLRDVEYIEYPSPSQTLFLSNYSKIKEAIYFDKNELEKWYAMVKDKVKQRVCLNHGNLKSSHAIINDKTYLINWKDHSFDSPIVDILRFYDNEWDKVDFSTVLESYFNHVKLSDDEKKLLFINMTIPKIINSQADEYMNVIAMRRIFDYLYKTERLIGPYYTVKNEE